MVTTTGTTKTDSRSIGFDLPSVEEATDRLRTLSEKVLDSSKKVGLDVVETQEKALQGLVKTVSDLGASFSQSARDLLK